ncbi:MULTISPECIES: 30S ribosomal protein S6 [Prosthecobacter]|uniref:Small ribosomal subunit protein bS6 n=2 Tax=Prosthecobacter TaxID=48463 RepID=A0A7W7YPM1_9BACT|nr:30S ribosomal protein S6 [Prosthecobacter dejongeii]MBB5039780.1 small subunit ribosomal protein S6 [Prosthecobacter dejongeii]
MKRKYEAMIVLDMKGKEESVEELVSGIGREMEKSGVKLEQIDKLGKRKFPFNPRHVESGYFVNYQIEADNAGLDSIRAKLKLHDSVYQQYYQRR